MGYVFIHPIFNVFGGAEKVMLDLHKALLKDKKDSKIFTLFQPEIEETVDNLFHLRVKDIPLSSLLGFKVNPKIRTYSKLLAERILMTLKEDDKIVYTNFPGSLIVYEMLKMKKLKNKIYFISFEPDRILYYNEQIKANFIPEDVKDKKFGLYSKFLNNWRKIDRFIVERKTHKIITLSAYVAHQTNTIYRRKDAYDGLQMYIDTKKLSKKSKAKSREVINKEFNLNLKPDDFVILSQSRLEKSKGILELMAATRELRNMPNVKLLIGGKGELYDQIKEISQKAKNIHVLGFIPDEVLYDLFNSANVFSFLGDKETGGPLTVLEAMGSKSIVVASDNGGPPELIKDGEDGILVNRRNKLRIKNIFEELFVKYKKDKKSFDKLTKKAQDRVKKEFNFNIFYKRFKENF